LDPGEFLAVKLSCRVASQRGFTRHSLMEGMHRARMMDCVVMSRRHR
jgi:hypothetical protein